MANVRKPKVDGYDGYRKMMPCLKCNKEFMTHPGRRICSKCTQENSKFENRWAPMLDPNKSRSGRRVPRPRPPPTGD